MSKSFTVVTNHADGSVAKMEGLWEQDVLAVIDGTLANSDFTSITITPEEQA